VGRVLVLITATGGSLAYGYRRQVQLVGPTAAAAQQGHQYTLKQQQQQRRPLEGADMGRGCCTSFGGWCAKTGHRPCSGQSSAGEAWQQLPRGMVHAVCKQRFQKDTPWVAEVSNPSRQQSLRGEAI
jgi:hypothetical protein